MEQEANKLAKLGKVKLLEIAKNLGLEVNEKDTVKHIVHWILEEVEDLNTFLEASANAKKDGMNKASGVKKEGQYRGKHPVTGEKLYS